MGKTIATPPEVQPDTEKTCCHHSSHPDHAQSNAAGAIYTCPMHPEIEQTGPGDCPKCGMALEPKNIAALKSSKTQYTCPMHPEIIRDEPGDCPSCGMALEPLTVSLD